jgi:hypothetical protein
VISGVYVPTLGSAGWSCVRSGPALAYLHAERAESELPPGQRRAGTLEDVFVLLTGEQAA